MHDFYNNLDFVQDENFETVRKTNIYKLAAPHMRVGRTTVINVTVIKNRN